MCVEVYDTNIIVLLLLQLSDLSFFYSAYILDWIISILRWNENEEYLFKSQDSKWNTSKV